MSIMPFHEFPLRADKEESINKVSTKLLRRGVNGVIPFAMELVLLQVHSPNFLIRHLPAGRVFPAIQTTSHLEQWIAPGRRGFTDARRGLAIAAIPLGGAAAAGYNTYGGGRGAPPRNTQIG